MRAVARAGWPWKAGDFMQAMEGGGLLKEDFVPTQMAVVRSPEVVRRAIATVGLDNLPSLKR
jgi:hypothetical protein